MTVVIGPPDPIDVPGKRVFLGGAIDLGAAPDWQADVVRALAGHDGLVLLNPRRPEFDLADLDHQIRWELHALEAADLILMWFPAGSSAPISLLETGLHLRSGRLVLGADETYGRRRNLEITAEVYGVPLRNRLDQLLEDVVRAL
ncbi:nucleoside 2-deoxyribosyltransferase domain-containing protein [Asanoa sp. NPDC049518]|uniref:nucleoside 2-deoxyribosyltransferase domain-containing protein n=1 Tax=unclassified Asanoa TaxID=2685164 RepID=UPI0034212282